MLLTNRPPDAWSELSLYQPHENAIEHPRPRKCSVNHDISLRLMLVLRNRHGVVGVLVRHLRVFVHGLTFTFAFDLFFCLIFLLASAALGFQILAACLGRLVVLLDLSPFLLGTSHVGIAAFCFGSLSFRQLLLLIFLCTIGRGVVLSLVGFGLVGWELGWS